METPDSEDKVHDTNSDKEKSPLLEEEIFVEKPADDYFCPVTKGVLLQPYLTECCGQHLSSEAVSHIGEGGVCPMCRDNLHTVLDKHFMRKVNSLRVYCPHKHSGCAWEGELGIIHHHMLKHKPQDLPLPYEYVSAITRLPRTEETENSVKLFVAVAGRSKSATEMLLLEGANPDMLSSFSPLLEASRYGFVEIVELLLEKGANPNLTNDEKQTALILAANKGHYETVDMLLQNGANPDMQDHAGWTALMAAVYKQYNKVALRIVQAHATPHIQDRNLTNAILLAIDGNDQEEVVDELLKCINHPFQINVQNRYGETALMIACRKGSILHVKSLLSLGANINLKNQKGKSSVDIAKESGEIEILKELSKYDQNIVTVPNVNLEVAVSSASQAGQIVIVAGVPLFQQQFLIYTGKKLDFIWEEAGISLHFPADDDNISGESSIKITVEVLKNVEEESIYPRGYRLMPAASAAYKITTSSKLPQPVRVKIQHCAVFEDEISLTFMMSHCRAPYRFKPLTNGKFSDSHGEIEVRNFSLFTILYNIPWLTIASALHVVYLSNNKMRIAVTKNNPAHCTAVREEYPSATIETYQMRVFRFRPKITFSAVEDDSTAQQKQWIIKLSPTPHEIYTTDIATYEIGCAVPSIVVEVEWHGEGEPQEQQLHIKVEGGSIESFPISCKPPEYHQSHSTLRSVTVSDTVLAPERLSQSLFGIPTLPELIELRTKSGGQVINVIEAMAPKYHDLGILLLDDKSGFVTINIETKSIHHGDPTRITEAIAQEWLQGRGKKPVTWGTLVSVLGALELNTLAENIKKALAPEGMSEPSESFSTVGSRKRKEKSSRDPTSSKRRK